MILPSEEDTRPSKHGGGGKNDSCMSVNRFGGDDVIGLIRVC